MKTIATLNGVMLMSQDGEALEAMQANAAQYGAEASVVTDLEYAALVAAQQQPSPTVVSMRQARLALLQQNILATVDAAIAQGGQADQIEWEYATTVDRNSALVTNMAAALSLTEQDLDNLFTLASGL